MGMLSPGVGLTRAPPRGSRAWALADLGVALLDMWDAEQTATLSLTGSAVDAWRSSANAYSASQATPASRPAYSDTAFNGRPGVTFDGVDDHLNYEGVGVLPIGATPCEIWALVDQTALAADTSARYPFDYGGATSPLHRGIRRGVTAGVNQASASIGNGASATTVTVSGDFSGRTVVRAAAGATQTIVSRNGQVGNPSSIVPGTTAVRTRIGATTVATPANFFQGVVSLILVTAPLSTDQAASLLAFLKTRGGIA